MTRHGVLFYTVLHCACAVLHCTCAVLHCTALYCIVLYLLYYTVLWCAAPHSTALLCNATGGGGNPLTVNPAASSQWPSSSCMLPVLCALPVLMNPVLIV